MDLVTLTFDRLILKLVCESQQRWGTFVLNLDTLGLRVLELFAMYATDRRTDRQTDGRTKANLIAPSYGRGYNNDDDDDQDDKTMEIQLSTYTGNL